MNSNNNIKFLGYASDFNLKQALKHRKYTMSLKDFYNNVNQTTSSGCSCCKQDGVKVYCILPVGLPIKPIALSLCAECLQSLPMALTVINLDSNGAPPTLIYRQYESEV